jgi:nicotinamidase/pyrazinamidase
MSKIAKDSVLVMIDVQNDFCPGGSLEVPAGDSIIPVLNRLSPLFPCVVATKDWHPEDHISFASQHEGHEVYDTIQVKGEDQILWPDHCVPGTPGAEFHPALSLDHVNLILHKGLERDLDSYSAFYENDHETATGLEYYLKGLGIKNVYIGGLARDVCVYFSCLDAVNTGFKCFLISDASVPVDVPEGNAAETLDDMKEKGVEIIHSDDIAE